MCRMFSPDIARLRRAALVACAVAFAAAAALLSGIEPARAQDDLTTPPRISDSAETGEDARATRPPPDTQPQIEEIVVISDTNPWRLPDLGSSWRAAQEAEPDSGRISADLLPLWDPESEELPTRNPFAVTDSIRRVGFIEVFRLRFGGR